ncbi:MAG TPA: hydroxyisourate hydrolase [Trebonia sp.]|jgi:5-hydroxyisourate hydrolase|nr:hydroxyisourate hydrolase [Trebonia sp.]
MKISARVLDGTYGKPAAGVHARLTRATESTWTSIAVMETDENGLIEDWDSWNLERGLYQVVFDSDRYFASLGTIAAYPEVVIMFRMVDDAHAFQVQVILAPYAYSTYFSICDEGR